jgi:hypothetical protein
MPKVADLYVEIGAKLDNFDRGMKSVQRSTRRMEKGLGLVVKRMIAIGAVYFGARGIFKMSKSFLEVAASVEQYGIRLKTLLGSQKAATIAMGEFQRIASKLPFTLDQVIESGIRLTTIKVPFQDWLVPIADVAAAFGLDLPTATDQFARAMSAGLGAADWFREKGISAMIKDFAKLEFAIDDLAKAGTGKLREVMFEWAKTFKGSSEDMSKTWNGIISMLQDKWFQFRDAVMQSQVFNILKEGLASFNDKLDEFMKTGRLDVWAADMAIGVIGAFKLIVQAVQTLMIAWHALGTVIFKTAEFAINAVKLQINAIMAPMRLLAKIPIVGELAKKILKEVGEHTAVLTTISEGYNEAARNQGEALVNVIEKFEAFIAKLEAAKELVRDSKKDTKEVEEGFKQLGATLSEMSDKQKDIFLSLANAMQSGITGIMNVLKQWVIGEFLKALSTSKMPFLVKLGLLIPTIAAVNAAFGAIKGFQYEGVAHTPTVAMIAEREPERVIRESTFQRMRADGGGMSLTVAPVFQISAMDAEGVRDFIRNRGLQEIVEAIKAGVQKPEMKNALGLGT